MRRRSGGFTVVELLIASAILLVLLATLGSVYVSTRRAYEVNRTVTSSSARIQAAIEAIQYDIGLAGYCGDPSECAVGASPLAVDTETQDGVQVVKSLTSQYEESRYQASPSVQSVEFEVDDGQLFRAVGGQRVPVAEGVDRLVLLGYRRSDDVSGTLRTGPVDHSTVRALDLRLELTQDGRSTHQDFTVVMANL